MWVKLFFSSGFSLLFLSASFFATADVTIKYVSTSSSPVEIAFVRFLLGGSVLLLMILPRGIPLRGRNTLGLFLRGLFGSLSFFCFLKSLASIPLSDAMVLLYTYPLFSVLFSYLLYKEAVGKMDFILIAIGLVGIYILINPGFHSYHAGYIWGVLAGIFGGVAIVLIKKLRETNGSLIIYFYFCLVGGILSFPYFIRGFRIPHFDQAIFLILIALAYLIGQILMNQGFKFCKASEGSVILTLEVVLTGIAGFVIFTDPITANFLIGASLVVGAGIGLNSKNQKPAAPASSG